MNPSGSRLDYNWAGKPVWYNLTVIQTYFRYPYSEGNSLEYRILDSFIYAGKSMVFAMVTGSTNIRTEAVGVTEVL